MDMSRLQHQVLQLEANLKRKLDDEDATKAKLMKVTTRCKTLEMNLKSEQEKNASKIADLGKEAEQASEEATAAKAEAEDCRNQIAALKGQKAQLEQQLKDALLAGATVRPCVAVWGSASSG